MKEKVINTVTSVDFGSKPYQLVINKGTSTRSLYCGIISVMILILLLYYSVSKLLTLGKVISSQNHESKNNPTFNLDDFEIAIYLYYVDFFSKQPSTFLNTKNMHQLGFHIEAQYFKNEVDTKYNMTDLADQDNNSFFTLPKQFPTELHYKNKNYQQSWKIIISKCSSLDFADCKTVQNWQWKYLFIFRGMTVNSNYVDQGQVQQYVDYGADFLTLEQKSIYERQTLVFNAYEHYSDLSVLPTSFQKPTQTKSWCFFDANTLQNKILGSQIIKQIQFKASQYTYYQSERMQKIDEILPQILSLFSVATLILATVSSHYRSWAFSLSIIHELKEQKKARETARGREYNDQNEEVMEINLKNYFKYIFNLKKDKSSIDSTSKKIKKVNKKIDILEINKQVIKLKKAIKAICQKQRIKKQEIQNLIQNISESESQQENQIKENKTFNSSEKSLIHS